MKFRSAAPAVSGLTLAMTGAAAFAQDAVSAVIKPVGVMPHDLSPWSMFMSADIVVKAVMVGLALASLVTWTVFFAKTWEISRAKSRLEDALARVADAPSVGDARARAGFRCENFVDGFTHRRFR